MAAEQAERELRHKLKQGFKGFCEKVKIKIRKLCEIKIQFREATRRGRYPRANYASLVKAFSSYFTLYFKIFFLYMFCLFLSSFCFAFFHQVPWTYIYHQYFLNFGTYNWKVTWQLRLFVYKIPYETNQNPLLV